MSNFSYDDFAVLVRSFRQDMLDSDSLRIVPLSTEPSMAAAIIGTNLEGLDSELNLPREKDGSFVRSNVTVQHNSAGYCRLVGHIEAVKPQEGQEVPVTTAKAFVLYHLVKDGSAESAGGGEKPEVIAVASLKEGFEIGDVCYPSFTITTVNNYQSVAFNPNAFATVEDLKNINGLDGLHIAFDTASGDLKLLDKDGNVLDQANLPIKADVIIAEGEEGYKYVKTDVKQDIHAAKAWMPEGTTAWEDVPEASYIRKHAALVMDSSRVFVESGANTEHTISAENVDIKHVEIGGSIYMVADISAGTCSLFKIKGDSEICLYHAKYSDRNVALNTDGSQYEIIEGKVSVDVIKHDVNTYVLGEMEPTTFQPLTLGGERYGNSGSIKSTGEVVGITTDGTNLYTFDENAGTPSKIHNISGKEVRWLDIKTITEFPNHTLKYGLEAFVWTVKDREVKLNEPFFQQLNASLLDLGFHEGDDIALGTNLAKLSTDLNKVDADQYMHGETNGKDNKPTREKEVDDQRKLAKEELVAWNAQHPELTHSAVDGTRISSAGVDIRNGKISIGDGLGLGDDAVAHYELSTNFSSDVAPEDGGLALSVLDASGGNPIRNVLTISDSSYISGAPICMALMEVTVSGGTLSCETKRRTACFECEMSESDGTVDITITDKRLNSKGFATTFSARDACIVEISPVYISSGSASEMLPALNMVNTVATVGSTAEGVEKKDKLTCTCPQIIDWANSVNLSQTGNSARLFVIVKVY